MAWWQGGWVAVPAPPIIYFVETRCMYRWMYGWTVCPRRSHFPRNPGRDTPPHTHTYTEHGSAVRKCVNTLERSPKKMEGKRSKALAIQTNFFASWAQTRDGSLPLIIGEEPGRPKYPDMAHDIAPSAAWWYLCNKIGDASRRFA